MTVEAVPYHRGKYLRDFILTEHAWLEAQLSNLSGPDRAKLDSISLTLALFADALNGSGGNELAHLPELERSLQTRPAQATLPGDVLPLLDAIDNSSTQGQLNLHFIANSSQEAGVLGITVLLLSSIASDAHSPSLSPPHAEAAPELLDALDRNLPSHGEAGAAFPTLPQQLCLFSSR